MRTRKRAVFPTHVSSSVCAHERTKAKRARLSKFTTAAHFADQLRQQGFALLTPDDSTFFSIAAEALQGQLKVCGQRPEHAKFPGFQAFEHKQRLEYQAGSAVAPELVTLHQLTTEVVQQLDDIARQVLAQMADGLNLPWKAFESLLGTAVPRGDGAVSASILDTIQYTAPTLSRVHGADRAANCEAHVDKGVLTLILPDTSQGLQVMMADGTWHNLPVPRGNIAVLTGYTLERATCGLVKAVTHRVVMGSGGCLTARNVVAYKLRAADNAVIDLYPTISLHHDNIHPRLKTSIGVQELMHFFDATHRSINAAQQAMTATNGNRGGPGDSGPADDGSYIQGLTSWMVLEGWKGASSVLLKVRSQDGAEVQFKMLAVKPLRDLIYAYLARRSLSRNAVKFMYEGCLLANWDKTCEDLKMESGDIIDAMLEQVGD